MRCLIPFHSSRPGSSPCVRPECGPTKWRPICSSRHQPLRSPSAGQKRVQVATSAEARKGGKVLAEWWAEGRAAPCGERRALGSGGADGHFDAFQIELTAGKKEARKFNGAHDQSQRNSKLNVSDTFGLTHVLLENASSPVQNCCCGHLRVHVVSVSLSSIFIDIATMNGPILY